MLAFTQFYGSHSSLIDTVKFLVVRGVLAGERRCKNGHIMNLVNYDNGDGCMWRCGSHGCDEKRSVRDKSLIRFFALCILGAERRCTIRQQ